MVKYQETVAKQEIVWPLNEEGELKKKKNAITCLGNQESIR